MIFSKTVIQYYINLENDMKKDYKEWFMEKWNENGGLVSQKDAALILKKSPTRIRQMINEGKLKTIQFDETRVPFVSLQQVLTYYKAKSIFEEAADMIESRMDNLARKALDLPEDYYPDDPPKEREEKLKRHRGARRKNELKS